MISYIYNYCNNDRNYSPMQLGLVLQFQSRHVTVADPDRLYPVLQLYITVPPCIVLVGVPGDPFEIEGGRPQPNNRCK